MQLQFRAAQLSVEHIIQSGKIKYTKFPHFTNKENSGLCGSWVSLQSSRGSLNYFAALNPKSHFFGMTLLRPSFFKKQVLCVASIIIAQLSIGRIIQSCKSSDIFINFMNTKQISQTFVEIWKIIQRAIKGRQTTQFCEIIELGRVLTNTVLILQK